MISRDILSQIPTTHPDRIAIETGADSVSYFELTHASKALAVALQTKDPVEGSAVALCAAPSAETIAAVLAIHAAGKRWIPLELDSDEAQIHRTLTDTTPATIMLDPQGSELVHADADAIIHFSQFPGLVHTYFGQEPEGTAAACPAATPLTADATVPPTDANERRETNELNVRGTIDADTVDKIAAVLRLGGKIILPGNQG